MLYTLTFRYMPWKIGGPVKPGTLVPTDTQSSLELERELSEKSRIIFLIHGYNNDRDVGLRKLGNLAKSLSVDAQYAIVSVLWPGDSHSGALTYSWEGKDADDTAAEFVLFLDRIKVPKTTSLNFVTHSLGARVAMMTANALTDRDYVVDRICLMAAAIDHDSLADPNQFLRGANHANQVAVLSSKMDSTLHYVYPLGDLLQSFLFGEPHGFALGYRGPAKHRKHDLPTSVRSYPIPDKCDCTHGKYLTENLPATENALSAAIYASDVLNYVGEPRYPDDWAKAAKPKASKKTQKDN
jgi:pimeloyl-ACP methyl ester carboxylesterase